MRYTRNRQLSLLGVQKNCINTRIDEMKSIHWNLDKSFKWHREYNCVSFIDIVFGREFAIEVGIHKRRIIRF